MDLDSWDSWEKTRLDQPRLVWTIPYLGTKPCVGVDWVSLEIGSNVLGYFLFWPQGTWTIWSLGHNLESMDSGLDGTALREDAHNLSGWLW